MTSSSVELRDLHHDRTRRSARQEDSHTPDIVLGAASNDDEAGTSRAPEPSIASQLSISPSGPSNASVNDALGTSTTSNDDLHPLTGVLDDGASLPAQRHQASVSAKLLLLCWVPELVASALSVVSLITLIVVLRIFNGRPVTDTILPRPLTLNGLVAAIATINRACLNTPTCAALMQEMWLFLLGEAKKKKCRSRLGDMDMFTDASTGAWGSVQFFFRVRRSGALVASIGCLITLVSLGYSTFVQQLVALELLETSSIGNVPRTEEWGSVPLRPPEITAAFQNGLFGVNQQQPQVSCPTNDCRWPSTPSLAFCGACKNSTYTLTGCAVPDCTQLSIDGCNHMQSVCNYTLASGNAVLIGEFNLPILTAGRIWITFQVVTSSGHLLMLDNLDTSAALLNVELFGLPFEYELSQNEDFPLSNTECALWPCVQSYDTTVTSTGIHQLITYESINRLPLDGFTPLLWDPVPVSLDEGNETTFSMDGLDAASMALYIRNEMQGNVTTFWEDGKQSHDYSKIDRATNAVYSAWNGIKDPHEWIANIAGSMTNAMRSLNQTSRDQYNGTAYELCINVRWWWLVGPVALVSSSIAFLIAVMIRTSLHPEAQSWKGSPLTFLLFDLQSDVREAALRRMDEAGWNASRRDLGKTKVRLVTDVDGGRKFHAL